MGLHRLFGSWTGRSAGTKKKVDDGKLQVVALFSRKLTSYERNYSVHKKDVAVECADLVRLEASRRVSFLS